MSEQSRPRRAAHSIRRVGYTAMVWLFALVVILVVFAVNFVLFIGRPSWPFGI